MANIGGNLTPQSDAVELTKQYELITYICLLKLDIKLIDP